MNANRSEAYREEAAELLTLLESSLLELEQRPQDEELVASVFRSLHTIKGSGAMFGFDTIAGFTHEVETVFDLVRDGVVPVTAELIGVTLAARDHIQRLLASTDGEAQRLSDEGAQILERLRQEASVPAPQAAPAAPGCGADFQPAAASTDGEPVVWHIRFEPDADLMANGTNPLLLLNELRELGQLNVIAHLDRVPALDKMVAGQCYVWWEMDLTTAAGENAIRDVFIFVEDRARISIEQVAPVAGPETPALAAPAEEDARGGAREPKAAEDRRYGMTASATLRVPAAKLDQLVNVVGELVTVRARLSAYAAGREDAEITGIAEEVERLTEMLRENTMNIRMVPIGETFSRFKRLVRDLSGGLGKRVELVTEGNETELDKTVIEQLGDPLVHLVRNAVDHGIESPETRTACGKPPVGVIRLSASHAGAFVLIRLSDDGAGLNRAAIRARAVERGLIAPDAVLPDAEIDALIFAPGLSTASQVSELSGRGVGMDVVHRSLDALRGTLSVASTPGQGTTVTLRIPLTLAIIEGLLVEAGGQHFVVPLANVSECIEIVRSPASRGGRASLVTVRDEQVPYVALRNRFGLAGEPPPIEQVIIAETEHGRFGFVVDRVLGDHHAVVKKLGHLYRHVEEISGATILGDGTLALVLDVVRLAAAAVRENR